MIEKLIYMALWYAIGVGSMYAMQSHITEIIARREILVLGICGLLVTAMLLYMIVRDKNNV